MMKMMGRQGCHVVSRQSLNPNLQSKVKLYVVLIEFIVGGPKIMYPFIYSKLFFKFSPQFIHLLVEKVGTVSTSKLMYIYRRSFYL